MNDSQSIPTQQVVFAYFAHQATPLEQQLVENWLATPEGALMYFTYLDNWERQHPQFYPDVDSARQRFNQFIRQSEQEPVNSFPLQKPLPEPIPIQKRQMRWWVGIAASIAILLGFWLTTNLWYYSTQTTGFGQVRSVQLPDGSGITLGANSSVRYARFGFEKGIRQIWLTGEAEFRVTHQSHAHRFIVQTPDQTQVEVLGTVFKVSSRRNTTRVVLEKGRVQLTTPRTYRPLLLMPGDEVTVSAQGQARRLHSVPTPARVTWHDHRFVFSDTPLTEVAYQLHDTFGVTIHIPQTDLMTRTVTGTFEAETADDLLQALSLMMNIRIRQGASVYVLMQ